MEPRRKPHLAQEQLDRIIRRAAGKHAVEALVAKTPACQRYELDNGAVLTIRTRTGKTSIKGGGK
jgi:hypothetical protein